MNVAFIGLGIMGSRMAMNLIKGGNELSVWNRSIEKAEALQRAGAKVCTSVSEVVRDADVLITMLSSPEVIEKISLGKDGIMMNAKKNALWINTSTVNPSFAEELAAQTKEVSLRYLDSPVSGSMVVAEKGELIFLVGGETKDLEEARILLTTMGKSINHLGKVGDGSKMKMVINLMLAQSMIAFSEAVSLGVASGLNEGTVLNILSESPVSSPFLKLKKGKFESKKFDAEFSIKWAHKDLYLILQTAYENNISLPVSAITKEVYGMAKQEGQGDKDISAIYQYLLSKNF
ncbi:6-phosphogluconate dehydrogenase NAD-binding [Sporocytophaga myxococcoides]|uniref:6-phosphogluconate dehydrogenase NAD-binding n=1 Tax=Sporocytophaga myxococcoides TaxID=153721 RepID=A0A098LKY8_9BACT|nr:NAD(P)-dependent oxidoreductase [Sporocytophaga myxococcoides]GAL87645.1 6-phosphogluconate dehydrogenase NAD-binding [Sporocytophaga myxococcoides]